jgi:D-amino peptidase
MRVLIISDLEGITGVTRREQTRPGSPLYDEARLLYTEELNAAVRGAVAAGADDIVVVDTHGAGGGPSRFNSLVASMLDERCTLFVQDHWTDFSRLLEHRYDAAVLVGMHAMAGTEDACLSHTVSAADWWRLSVNDAAVGEIAITAALCGSAGCPVVFVSGDAAACAEATALLGRELHTVAVKQGFGDFSALHLSPNRTRALIEMEVRSALAEQPPRQLFTFTGPCEISLELTTSSAAQGYARRSGVTFAGSRRVVSTASTWLEAWHQIDG